MRPSRNLALAVAMALPMVTGLTAWAIADQPKRFKVHGSGQRFQGRPTPPPLLIRPLSIEAAVELNRKIPFTAGLTAAAKPFIIGGDEETRARALECLTAAIYYEAAQESRDGQRAVAQVVLNRVRHPAFPAKVCDVVFQGSTRQTGCQFSFTCDGSLVRAPQRDVWAQAGAVAWGALSGAVYAPVGLATHYHANYVVPYWATSLAKNAAIGLHIFYRWPGGEGYPEAFRQRHSTKELDPYRLRASALMVKGVWPYSPRSSTDRLIQTKVDQNVELAGVLALLARSPAANESPYETAARAYFAGHSSHLAVRIMRDAQAADVASPDAGDEVLLKTSAPIAGPVAIPAAWRERSVFSAVARDFARQSHFADFLDEHRLTFDKAGTQLNLVAMDVADLWENYTRVPVPNRKVVISLSSADHLTICLLRKIGNPQQRLPQWPASGFGEGSADIFIRTTLAQGLLDWRKTKIANSFDAAAEEQVVRAIFARIEALMHGKRAGARAVTDALEQGYGLTPLLVQRLGEYEMNSAKYRDLNEFLPTLVAGIERVSWRGRQTGVTDRKALC